MDINGYKWNGFFPHHCLFIVNARWEDDPIQLYGSGRPVDPSERPVGSGNAELGSVFPGEQNLGWALW